MNKPEADAAQIRVLLVEDNPADIALVEACLEESQQPRFSVTAVRHMREAVESKRTNVADVAICDLSLPDGCGMEETVLRLRQAAPELPVVVLTGNGGAAGRVAFEVGAEAFLRKQELRAVDLIQALLFAYSRGHAHAQLQRLVDASADAMIVLDQEHEVRFANRAAETLFGRPAQELMQQPLRLSFSVGSSTRLDVLRPGGEIRSAEVLVTQLVWRGEGAQLLTIRDVTEQVESEARYQALLQQSPDALLVMDEHGLIQQANSQAVALFGCGRGDLLGQSVGRFVPEFVLEGEGWEGDASGSALNAMVGRHASGKEFPVEVKLGRVHGGGPGRFMASIRDVSARHEAVRRLREAEALNRSILEAIPDLICVLSAEGVYLSVQAKDDSVLVAPAEDLLGKPVSDVLPPDLCVGIMEAISKALETGVTQALMYELPVLGGHLSFEARLSPAGEQVLVLIRDVTEQKQAERIVKEGEARLEQARKLESIGQLAGGVAHEFNNLLSVIVGYSGQILDTLGSGDPRRRKLKNVLKAGKRAVDLTSQLLTFSRKQPVVRSTLNLNDAVDQVRQFLRPTIGEHIQLELVLCEEPLWVSVDPGQLDQVLVNLAVNARHAMPDGGKLTLKTEIREVEEGEAGGLSPGPYATLSVSDTGCGMAEETLGRVFEPFFTTKDVGRGTGLGLATCYGIARGAKGDIRVRSTLGQGSCFTVLLPSVAQASEPEEVPEDALPARSLNGGETILLVEDEDLVRELAGEILRSRGYEVIEAKDGPEALELFATHSARIQLVFSDVVLPGGLNGLSVVEQARAQKDGVAVLLASGYAGDEVERLELSGGFPFLWKPYSTESLLEAVRDVLDAAL